MDEIRIINTIKDAFSLFEEILREGVDNLTQGNKVALERMAAMPTSDYTLKHPRGVFGIIHLGTNYNKKDGYNGRVVQLNQDMSLSVVSIIRFIDNGLSSVSDMERYGMLPAEYPELTVDLLSGIEIQSTRPAYDRRITPIKTELVDQVNGLWFYLTTFNIPKDFIEVNFRK